MAFKKYAKKVGKRIVRAVKKRYVRKGGPNMKNIISDVKMLKSLVNVEKKRVDNFISLPVSFGASAGAGTLSGHFIAIVTPSIVQGITGNQRNGNSIKLTSACMDIFFGQSVNTVNQIKIRWTLICKVDNGVATSGAVAVTQFYEPNPFNGFLDFHAPRDPEFFTAYRVIKTGTTTLKQDSLTSGVSYAQIKVPLKLNQHLKYNTNASIVTTKNEFYLIATADTGDSSSLTGANIQYNIRWYYTDN
jgi:hypothetical protein